MKVHATWEAARAAAELAANTSGISCGIERCTGPLERGYRVFFLPRPENRYGHELRCEVVDPIRVQP